MVLAIQNQFYQHMDLLGPLKFETFATPAPSNIPRLSIDSFGRRIFFDVHDLEIMNSPNALLNDTCLNGLARYLHHIFSEPSNSASPSSSRCALFSTFDLLSERYHATDADLWRRMRNVEYWLKDVWILPIHRSHPVGHWVLCTISLRTQELFLFDSFAEKTPWKRETKVSLHSRTFIETN
jgi:Ulp1 family protease